MGLLDKHMCHCLLTTLRVSKCTVLVIQKGKKTNNTPAILVQHRRGKNLLHSCNSLKSPTNNTVLTYHTKEFHTLKAIKKKPS
jgi:hypothetical protein